MAEYEQLNVALFYSGIRHESYQDKDQTRDTPHKDARAPNNLHFTLVC